MSTELRAELDALKAQLSKKQIADAFAQSAYVRDRLLWHPDIHAAYFGSSFVVEDGRVVGKDAGGNRIMSRTRLGEVADFDEAMSVLVNACPLKDQITKATGASGSGAAETRPAAKTMSRAAFEALSPAECMAYVKAGGMVHD